MRYRVGWGGHWRAHVTCNSTGTGNDPNIGPNDPPPSLPSLPSTRAFDHNALTPTYLVRLELFLHVVSSRARYHLIERVESEQAPPPLL